jgi:uncharacterized membrane protein YdbT with pleckstrin-like domain
MSEQTLYEAHPAMFRNHPFGFILCLLLSVVGVGLLIFLYWWLKCLGNTLTVTEQKTTLRTGILSKTINEVFHSDVRSIQVSQSLFQRIFGVGSIGISSAGQSSIEIVATGIPDPNKVRELINTHRTHPDHE